MNETIERRGHVPDAVTPELIAAGVSALKLTRPRATGVAKRAISSRICAIWALWRRRTDARVDLALMRRPQPQRFSAANLHRLTTN